jgi:hypoxanthine phosphoribosyltransferase
VKATPEEAWRVLETADEICSAQCVAEEVARIAREITAKLAHRHPLVLSVMRGSVVFSGQLLPQLHFPLNFDYLDVTRYGSSTVGGAIAWKVSPGTGVTGRVVLVLDDILDEGHTLAAVRDKLIEAGGSEFYSAVFALKNTGHARPIEPDFIGITVPNRYVFGFGMDVYGAWRNLPAIYALREEKGERREEQ